MGCLLSFGGVCYIFIHTLKSFFPHFGETILTIESILMAPMALSEIGFAIWLIVKFTRLNRDLKNGLRITAFFGNSEK